MDISLNSVHSMVLISAIPLFLKRDLVGMASYRNQQLKFREFPKKAHRSGIPLKVCPVNHVSKSSIEYEVDTVSLNDLLERYDAPREIDYLSIDTEGTEFEIIRNFDFKKYKVAIITIEHNQNRKEIYSLLSSHGYQRALESVSIVDDWYVLV